MNWGNGLRNTLRWALLTLLSVAALALVAEGRRTVKGIVTDQNGNPLNGAIVQVENMRTLAIRSYITQEHGTYEFHGLDPNVDYKLTAVYHDDSSSAKTLSTFDSRTVAFIDLRITLK